MRTNAKKIYSAALTVALLLTIAISAFSQQTADSATAAAKAIGAINELNGNVITLTPDSGPAVNISAQPATQIFVIAPGEKSLANATTSTLEALQVGDRIRVTGKMSDDGKTLLAAKIIAIKSSELAARHQHEMQDWQKRGVGGIATAVDPAAGTVTITVRNKPLVVHTSSATVIRRYPPDSVKFDDAKTSTLPAIQTGDQVRARGERSPDATSLTAEEIVSGNFPEFAGTIESVDASSSLLSVRNLITHKTVMVRVTPDSQLRKLPPEMAQSIANRLKRALAASLPPGAPGAGSGAQKVPPAESSAKSGSASGADALAEGSNGAGAGPGSRGGPPDIQQMMARLPPLSLADLHRGDAVLVLSTQGAAASGTAGSGAAGSGTAITLLTGVDPILQAAPNASSYSLLSPWTLGASAGDSGGP